MTSFRRPHSIVNTSDSTDAELTVSCTPDKSMVRGWGPLARYIIMTYERGRRIHECYQDNERTRIAAEIPGSGFSSLPTQHSL